LRVRLHAADAPAGRAAALELLHALAERSPALIGDAPAGASLGGLRVRVPAARPGERHAQAGVVVSALSRAVSRAGRGS
jgi:hypothetical protein